MKFFQFIYKNFFNFYSYNWKLRISILLSSFLIVVSIIFFVQFLVNKLVEKEQNLIISVSSIYKTINSNISNSNSSSEDLLNILEQLQSNITFPVIATNYKDEANYPYEFYTLNVEIDSTLNRNQQKELIDGLVQEMKSKYQPVVVTDSNNNILMKLYYKNSNLIEYLNFFPMVVVIVLGSFFLFTYLIFNNIRKTQESILWVGMTKEAAHQMGTPLSSLLAWIQILKTNDELDQNSFEAVNEMEKDILRLEVISQRFSKIGSIPKLQKNNLSEIIQNTVNYFNIRLPNMNKKVMIFNFIENENILIDLNTELFVWVLENLIKNSVESIDNLNGRIEIFANIENKYVNIEIKDNGKGMTSSIKNKIFDPGFSTKKKGWGLGLSLSKRIIEEYHKGKIYIKETNVGKGSVFAIRLPLN